MTSTNSPKRLDFFRGSAYNAACHRQEEQNMHDELTREDIRKMKEELDYRRLELMPGLIE